MPDLVINICLLSLGIAGSLAAIRGETWDVNKRRFLKKITVTGWIASICLLFTLVLGIVKEHRSSLAATAAEKANQALIITVKNTQTNLIGARGDLRLIGGERDAAEASLLSVLDDLGESDERHGKKIAEAASEISRLKTAVQLSQERFFGLVSIRRTQDEIFQAIDLDYDEPLIVLDGEVIGFHNYFQGMLTLITRDVDTGDVRQYPMPPGTH